MQALQHINSLRGVTPLSCLTVVRPVVSTHTLPLFCTDFSRILSPTHPHTPLVHCTPASTHGCALHDTPIPLFYLWSFVKGGALHEHVLLMLSHTNTLLRAPPLLTHHPHLPSSFTPPLFSFPMAPCAVCGPHTVSRCPLITQQHLPRPITFYFYFSFNQHSFPQP